MDNARIDRRRRQPDQEPSAEQAKLQLQRGIASTRAIVADYRRQLRRLARADRPLFRWPKDGGS
ncbi:MAG: hypothetical protein AVDCRST_MAG23-2332 [uncultured Sphingosinicella sp.]|uniref:Uncharacterized protein n=1 Tax=uncultured Sphingosinicella sp. TaxID=478748 RepID=A0A6J4UB88_9SPHN|nr:hypothetical protein [uncultured Sphingosinicella sp.]CAA9543624.1 MAG: hypothetical protein AVDCRST_MAG23-2332 [uncultured Sphingosinicella sp.]